MRFARLDLRALISVTVVIQPYESNRAKECRPKVFPGRANGPFIHEGAY